MHTTNQQRDRLTAQEIIETVEHPKFDASQLPGLRQRLVATDSWIDKPQYSEWSSGTAALYCDAKPTLNAPD